MSYWPIVKGEQIVGIHPNAYKERLEEEGGQLVRVVRAYWNKTKKGRAGSADVAKEYEDGTVKIREMVAWLGYYGYWLYGYNRQKKLIDEKARKWYTVKKKYERNYGQAIRSTYEKVDRSFMKRVIKKHPGFKWLAQKLLNAKKEYGLSKREMWKWLMVWKRWPDCERMWDAGYKHLAQEERMINATKEKKKEIMKWLNNEKLPTEKRATITFREIAARMRGVTEKEYEMTTWQMGYLGFAGVKEIRYFLKQEDKIEGISDIYKFIETFRDYKNMLNQTEHNKKDPYWAEPKDLILMHRKLTVEVMRRQKIKEAEEKKKKEERLCRIMENLKKVMEEWKGKEVNVGSMRAYVPETREEIVKHAKALSQCLISGGYDREMGEGKKLLVFITKNGRPKATAEVFDKNVLGQFKGDEAKGWKNCDPDEAEKAIFEEWRSKFKFNKNVIA